MPCKYCGRTKQTPQHKACDGCGAVKYVMTMRVEHLYGWTVVSPNFAIQVLNA